MRKYGQGFTLIELLVAIGLSMVLSVSIMWIATQTQKIYNRSVNQVELYKKLRYAFSLMENELARMVPTSDLEFFVDINTGAVGSNGHWEPNEEIRSAINLAGGYGGDDLYTEAPQIVERYYYRENKREKRNDKLPAFEIYFRAPVRFGNAIIQSNVEYRLVKATDLVKLMASVPGNRKPKIPYTKKQLPRVVSAKESEELSLVRIVRYMKKSLEILEKPMWNDLMRTHLTEISSDVESFKIEYYACNPYGRVSDKGARAGEPMAGWYTPALDRRSTAVEMPTIEVSEANNESAFVKQFIYGTSRMTSLFPPSKREIRPPRGIIRRAIKMDPRSNARMDTRPPLFYVPQQFGELGVGDTVYLWPDQSANQPFYGGEYTVKNSTYRGLVFHEPIETSSWRRDKTGLRFKAAYLPMALRITMVLSLTTDKAKATQELKRIIRLKTKTNA